MRFRQEIIGDCRMMLGDCADVLETLPAFDAVVCDPPYGISAAAKGTIGTSRLAAVKDYGAATWDNRPISPALLRAVRAAGRWNIIFGGNYYDCPASSCWLVWDKLNTGDFADCELAWTNLPKAVRRLRYLWNGCMRANGETRGDHPTQKPIGVMKWALQQLPAGVSTILDPFAGSGTTGVAAVGLGLSFTGIEREPTYFDIACRRIEEAYRQPRLFTEPAEPKPVQTSLLEANP